MTKYLLLALAALLISACNSLSASNPTSPTTPTTTPPAGSVQLASGTWTPSGAVRVAQISNGPWTLAQGAATLAAPLSGYCMGGQLSVNTALHPMQPYYFPFIQGQGQNLTGYFDYRVKDQDEAVIHAASSDGGLTWTADASKLRLHAGQCPADSATPLGDDDGQGHPVVLKINAASGPRTYLYTLDRQSSVVDTGGLLVHDVVSGAASLPDSQPVSDAAPVPAGLQQTSGLQNPDGILGAVPGTGLSAADPLKVMYLKKLKGSAAAPAAGLNPASLCTDAQSKTLAGKKANHDRTELRLASTSDGLTFTDLGAVNGLNNPDDNATDGFRFVGPRGTLLRYQDGSYGLFFSGGNCQDGDSDAYHFIGYAHSKDAVSWTVDQGAQNPLVQVDYSYPAASPAANYSGRVYAPNVIAKEDGSARLIFSGYRTGSPIAKTGASNAIGTPAVTFQPTDSANYRSILVVDLKH
ncbi:hypothetical protein GCM10022631_30610 [Deinococcus rubellus]|uniref:Exo-alpha-sialidase n=1 Tax=Deinococcus rubellus TaxID=1889240 RepID=A0ABY5YES8_9DEIO|nr:hypothetical protein [Deinococcus rubellus]UWX63572.1 hypothetical protein N0D28_12610 [Deinococcus rubellus]